MQIFLWDVEVIATQQQPWNKDLLMSFEKYAFRLQKMAYCMNYSDEMRRLHVK